MDRELARGIRAGLAAYLIWGLLTVYWKQLGDFDPFELIGWRMSMAAVVMAVVVTVRGSWPVIRSAFADRRLALRIVAAGLLLTTNWTTYVWAVVNDHIIETALGYFLAPLGLSAVGVFVLGERLTPLRSWGIGFAVAAVAVLTWSYGRLPLVAIILAVTWSGYGLLKRKVPLGPVESLAAAVRRRRTSGALHRARAAQLPGADHQLPARLARLRRVAARRPRRGVRAGVVCARGRHPRHRPVVARAGSVRSRRCGGRCTVSGSSTTASGCAWR
ncbi:MAG: EamA family transporter [Ilumatobacteraceae bacterium]|nr:EamA family transporter [Ilumatobacteraceae bacterium]